MLKCDRWITEQAGQGMIEPFQSGLVRHLEPEQKLRPEVPLCLSSPGHPGGAEAVAAVWSICRQHLIQGDLDQLVLDEIGLAVAFGYLDEADVIAALEQRPASMDVIITGPAIPAGVVEMADQVTELRRGF